MKAIIFSSDGGEIRDNHVRKIAAMLAAGEIGTGCGAIDVLHDDWCDRVNDRGPCNCDPDVRRRRDDYQA